MSFDQKKTYLLLGSNLGNRKAIIEEAINRIKSKVGKVFAKSSLYETAAWGKTEQPNFINLALGVETNLTPIELLKALLAIEKKLGRVRKERWGARLIDIDIIFYEHEVINQVKLLQIPHVEMQNRKFVLQPLAEIAPNYIHPILNKTVVELLSNLNDSLSVGKL